MKKAKIMLTVIVVLAVVGGALAFKAKDRDTQYVCYNNTGGAANLATAKTCTTSFTVDADITIGQQLMHYTIVDTYTKCTLSPTVEQCFSTASSIARE